MFSARWWCDNWPYLLLGAFAATFLWAAVSLGIALRDQQRDCDALMARARTFSDTVSVYNVCHPSGGEEEE